jgi:hypothetical protein
MDIKRYTLTYTQRRQRRLEPLELQRRLRSTTLVVATAAAIDDRLAQQDDVYGQRTADE